LFPVIYTGLYKLIGVIKNGSFMLVRIGNIFTLSVTQTKYFPFEKRLACPICNWRNFCLETYFAIGQEQIFPIQPI